jgi:microcystin-dependent protein
MGDWFLGEIRIFSFNWAPEGWALCNGAVLPIARNQALFALLGARYGGDGRTTFALPDLQGRAPIDRGQQAGDPNTYVIGDNGGAEGVSALPQHAHGVVGYLRDGDQIVAANAFPVQAVADSTGVVSTLYAPLTPGTLVALHPDSMGATGGGAAHENMEPFTVLNFCIATSGVFPPRS